MSGDLKRFSKAKPCPICSGHDRAPRGKGERCFGFLSEDELWAHCTREEHAGTLKQNPDSQAYAHRLHGDCRCGTRHRRAFDAPSTHCSASSLESAFDYRDEAGNVLFQALRYAPKSFKQRRPDGHGGWIWDLKGVRRVLYRLPELLAADPGQPVFIVEGEKKVDALRALGLIATCNAGGAGKWRLEYAAFLKGRHVVILPDNDEIGHKHAEAVAASIRGGGA